MSNPRERAREELRSELMRCFGNGRGGYIIDDSGMSFETLAVILQNLLTEAQEEMKRKCLEQLKDFDGFAIGEAREKIRKL